MVKDKGKPKKNYQGSWDDTDLETGRGMKGGERTDLSSLEQHSFKEF